MNALHQNNSEIALVSWIWISPENTKLEPTTAEPITSQPSSQGFDILRPLRQWLDSMNVSNVAFAHRICKTVPSQCPFERDIKLFGKTLFHIPPLCKLNPLYEEVVALRFRALCYLADECGEDVTQYC